MPSARNCSIWLALLLLLPAPLAAQPLQHHLMMATSTDGLAWQRLNVEFVDHGDVPDAVLGSDGRVYVFYQGLWTPTRDGIMVAVSADGIHDWTTSQVAISGTETWPGHPVDPDVLVDGETFRLYFTGDPAGDMYPETYSATSTDGVQFTRESGVRFEVAGGSVLDPSLLRTGNTLQYFAGGVAPGQNWHAHSTDGLAFVQQPNFVLQSLLMANGITVPAGGYRFYTFVGNQPQHGIRSLYSANGEDWTLEAGYRLELEQGNPQEIAYVKDPAVVYKDGTYLMYYVTRRPTTQAPLGDMNCDGQANSADIRPMVMALIDPTAYAVSFPNCRPELADLNQDGRRNGLDIRVFVSSVASF